MKVLQINAIYREASTGRMAMEMNDYLSQNGIESYVACPIGCDSNKTNEIVIGSRFDRKIHSIIARITGLQCYSSIFSTLKLINRISVIKPDIVHLGNIHSNYINIKLLFRYLSFNNIATVITLHDCWFYTGKCTHYTMDKCYKWCTSCGNCPRLKKDIPSWFFDCSQKMLRDKEKLYKSINRLGVVGVSQWITNEAKKSILKDACCIQAIYNWINIEQFSEDGQVANMLREKHHLFGKKIVLGVATLWSNAKGLDSFVKLSQIIEDNVIIVLIGTVNNIELPQNIINIPNVTKITELVGYYTLADVFLQLSPEESFGKVVAEAMSCGTPVIAVDSTANSELVSSDTGFICNVGDIFDIKSKIDIVLNNGKSQYRWKCREFVEKNFEATKQLDKYICLYKQLLSI